MIAPAGPQDAEEILEVINRANREAYRNLIPPEHFREPVLTLDELREAMGRMSFYLYRSAGRVVGVAALRREDAETGKLRWVYVLPEHQRQGIGTALVSFLEEQARALGLRRLYLRTVGGATWAVSFYRRLGYRPAGQVPTPWGQDWLMEKEVQMPTKVVHYTQIPAEPVAEAEGVTIRWLITRADGAPNFAMRLFELPPGSGSPHHRHDWEHEVFILEGEGVLRTEAGEAALRPGTAVLVPGGELHQFYNNGSGLLRFLCLIPHPGE